MKYEKAPIGYRGFFIFIMSISQEKEPHQEALININTLTIGSLFGRLRCCRHFNHFLCWIRFN
jgi:hypothetical protein